MCRQRSGAGEGGRDGHEGEVAQAVGRGSWDHSLAVSSIARRSKVVFFIVVFFARQSTSSVTRPAIQIFRGESARRSMLPRILLENAVK